MDKKTNLDWAAKIAKREPLKIPFNYKKMFINLAFIIAIFCGMYTVDAATIRINFYDENSLSAIPTVTITDSNGSIYTSDINGLWDVNLTGAKSFEISKTGYSARPLQMYFKEDTNYNFLLNPTSLNGTIAFTVLDENNNAWTNKYLMFAKQNDGGFPTKIPIVEYIYITNTTIYTTTAVNTYQLLKTHNIDNKYITKVTNEITTTNNRVDCNIIYTFTDDTTNNVNNFSSGGYTAKTYTNSINKPVKKIEIYLKASSDPGFMASFKNTNIYSDGNATFKTSIINSLLTSSTGTATGVLAPAGDYNALLYDANMDLQHTYQKTAVTINKPLNEKSGVAISPYDIYVGGLLLYNDTNRTEASRTLNIFAGTTGIYTFGVVDYNALVADQKYIQRTYSAQVPMGTSYVQALTIQPYLNLKTDAIIPSLYTLDSLNRPIAGVNVLVSKYINGVLTVVESGNTQSTGGFSFSAYPLDQYYITLVYNGENKGTYAIQPRTSADVYTFIIDTTTPVVINNSLIISVDWTGTPTEINIDTSTLHLIADVNSNLAQMTSYNLYFYQNNILKASTTAAITGLGTSIDFTIASALLDSTINQGVAKLVVNYTDANGTSGTQTFYFTVNLSHDNRNIMTSISSTVDDLGQPLAILIAILLTGLLLGALAMTGFNIGATGLTILGVLVLGLFMFLGFLDIGFTVLGYDIARFFYVLMGIGLVYFMMRGNQQ